MLIEVGTLSGITGATPGSGVSSAIVNLINAKRDISEAYFFASVEGDSGRTGGSVAVYWKGCYTRTGVTYAMEDDVFLVKSGTSVSGPQSNGAYLKKFNPVMPFIKLEASVSKSGSTQHGTGTTNTFSVRWALIVE